MGGGTTQQWREVSVSPGAGDEQHEWESDAADAWWTLPAGGAGPPSDHLGEEPHEEFL